MTSTRRHNGEGSVCRVSENKWIAKISLGTSPDGKTIMKQFSGKTETIVKKKLKEFKKSPYFTGKHLPSFTTARPNSILTFCKSPHKFRYFIADTRKLF